MVREVEDFVNKLCVLLHEKGFGEGAIGTDVDPMSVEDIKNWIQGKIWAMPAGDDRESLFESYGPVMNFVRDRGWRFTGRAHIMAFNTERCV